MGCSPGRLMCKLRGSWNASKQASRQASKQASKQERQTPNRDLPGRTGPKHDAVISLSQSDKQSGNILLAHADLKILGSQGLQRACTLETAEWRTLGWRPAILVEQSDSDWLQPNFNQTSHVIQGLLFRSRVKFAGKLCRCLFAGARLQVSACTKRRRMMMMMMTTTTTMLMMVMAVMVVMMLLGCCDSGTSRNQVTNNNKLLKAHFQSLIQKRSHAIPDLLWNSGARAWRSYELPWGSARQSAQGTQTSSSQARHAGAFEARGADGLRAASIAVPMLASKGNHINVTQPQSPVMRICFISGSKNEKTKARMIFTPRGTCKAHD